MKKRETIMKSSSHPHTRARVAFAHVMRET
jgi:hypothetical protein